MGNSNLYGRFLKFIGMLPAAEQGESVNFVCANFLESFAIVKKVYQVSVELKSKMKEVVKVRPAAQGNNCRHISTLKDLWNNTSYIK